MIGFGPANGLLLRFRLLVRWVRSADYTLGSPASTSCEWSRSDYHFLIFSSPSFFQKSKAGNWLVF
jgi:hypothetical protein